MHFKKNTIVVTSGEKKIGHLDRVVVDPATEEVTHLIVKKGFLFTEDRLIPAEYVNTTNPDKVILKKEAPDADDYPLFEETNFVPVGSLEHFNDKNSLNASKLLWYNSSVQLPGDQGGSYPSGSGNPSFYKEKHRNIPDHEIALEKGAAVTDIAGNDIGKIEDIFTEPETLKVTHILVSSGIIKKETKLIPLNWINKISEDFVQLHLSEETFKNLAHADNIMNK